MPSSSSRSRQSDSGSEMGLLTAEQMESQWQSAFSASSAPAAQPEPVLASAGAAQSRPPVLWEPPPEPIKTTPKPKPSVHKKASPSSAASPTSPSSSSSSLQAQAPAKAGGGVLVGVNLDAIMPKIGESKRADDIASRMVVLDAPNIAMRHGTRGNSKKFSCVGIKLAIDYYQKLGHKVIGFIPDFYLSYENAGKHKRAADIGVGGVRASKTPDDIGLLRRLMDEGTLAATPPQDYDDSYCIQYAMSRKGAVIITNDLYRDAVDEVDGKANKHTLRTWFKTHCCSYTFVVDEFLPNPDFNFPPAE